MCRHIPGRMTGRGITIVVAGIVIE